MLSSRNKHFQRNIDPVGIEEPETNIMRVEIQVIAPETFANSRQDQVGENSHVIWVRRFQVKFSQAFIGKKYYLGASYIYLTTLKG